MPEKRQAKLRKHCAGEEKKLSTGRIITVAAMTMPVMAWKETE